MHQQVLMALLCMQLLRAVHGKHMRAEGRPSRCSERCTVGAVISARQAQC